MFAVMVCACASARAERIELPLPPELSEHTASKPSDSLWGALVTSVVATIATGGKAVLISPARGDAPIVFAAVAPGEDRDSAVESFRISRNPLSAGKDERVLAEELAHGLTKVCPGFPARVVSADGAVLVERASTNCLRPGYRYNLSRYVRGQDGDYLLVYLARKEQPPEHLLEWQRRLGAAVVVP